MKATDIIALATAGYTAEQIAVIAKAAKEQPVQQPEQQPEQQPVQQPVQQPDGYADLMGRLDALTTQIQQSAILNSAQPREETADDILANIIDPPEFHPKK
jgi:hypothetical protein